MRLSSPATGLGIAEDTVLLQSQIDAIPLGARWTSIVQVTLAPGAVWELGRQRYDDDGPLLYRVESGSLTIEAEQPISLTAAGSSRAQALGPNTTAVLQRGDQGFTPAGVLSQWRNEGHDPVYVLQVRLSVIGVTGSCTTPPPGVSITPLIEQRAWADPLQPIILTVRQVTLPSRAVLPIAAVPGLELVYVVSGKLAAHDPPETSEPASLLIPALDGTGHPIKSGAAALGTFRPGRILRSSSNDAAVVLLLTIAPAERAGDTATLESQAPQRPVLRQALAPVQMSFAPQDVTLPSSPYVLREGVAACV